jgi:hypothetical protein
MSASWRPRVFMSLIGAILLAIGIAASLRNRAGLPGVGIALGFLTLWNVWLALFKIEADEDVVTYRTLLGGRRTMALRDLSMAVFETGYQSASALEPPSRLILVPRSSADHGIRINIGVFDDHDVRRLVEHLQARGVDVREAAD